MLPGRKLGGGSGDEFFGEDVEGEVLCGGKREMDRGAVICIENLSFIFITI